MLKPHYVQFASYNRWANRRLYDEAARLPDDARGRTLGLFFGSLHGTLNHLLVADRIWMHRFTGEGPQPSRLNEILYDDFAALREAREHEDERIVHYVGGLAEADFDATLVYRTTAGQPQTQHRRDALAHFFNHQTHHRGQAHAALTILGVPEPQPLDLLYMQRS